jgi:hypothetical protein
VEKIIKKEIMKTFNRYFLIPAFCSLIFFSVQAIGQDIKTDSSNTLKAKPKLIKNTFESNFILDNQTVTVPIKGSFEFDIQHRFGTIENGYSDLAGIAAPSNVRIAFEYVLRKNFQLGFGITTNGLKWDVNGKYSILKQAVKGGSPVSVTWFGNIAIDTRPKENFVTSGDRLSYFNQLLIARKLTRKISVQVATSISHFNNIEGYLDEDGKIQPTMKNDHFAIAFMGRYKLTEKTNIVVNYDQPLTRHPTNNPHPNISFGLEMVTTAHDFQVFFGNYHGILQQYNNVFNQNDYTKGQFELGFNISRLWNF